jgi:hypothetical protein
VVVYEIVNISSVVTQARILHRTYVLFPLAFRAHHYLFLCSGPLVPATCFFQMHGLNGVKYSFITENMVVAVLLTKYWEFSSIIPDNRLGLLRHFKVILNRTEFCNVTVGICPRNQYIYSSTISHPQDQFSEFDQFTQSPLELLSRYFEILQQSPSNN